MFSIARKHRPTQIMKPLRSRILPVACLSAAILSGVASAQTTATTDPVGFITLTINGATSTTSQLTFTSLGLDQPVAFQGTISTAGTNTIVGTGTAWNDNQFNPTGATVATATYYLELLSGVGIGTTYDITGTTAATQTITLGQNLPNGVVAGDTFRIRAYWTIASAFGTNDESGLTQGSSSTADQIRVYNGSTYNTYYYSNVGGVIGTGWRLIGDPNGVNNSQANAKLYPDEGVLITRQPNSGPLSIVLMGAVKTGKTSSPVFAGLNLLANPYAAPMTLTSSNLYTGDPTTGVAAGSSSTADLVRVYSPSTNTYNTYYYSNVGGVIGTGWRLIGDPNGVNNDQSSTAIPVGTSFLVTRQGASAFNWVAPQHPATIN